MNTSYPPVTAAAFAQALDSDPIVAGQIREYLSNDRLIELLGIQFPEPEEPSIEDFRDSEIVTAAIDRDLAGEVLEECDDTEIIAEVRARKISASKIYPAT